MGHIVLVLVLLFLGWIVRYIYRLVRDGKIEPFPQRTNSTFENSHSSTAGGEDRKENFKSGGGGDFGGGGASGSF
jgi:uncharacterized membrane protein YgcG